MNATANATANATVNYMNITACAAEKCSHSHTFSNDSVPARYDSVSVAAENVVGVGAARTRPTQPIGELKLFMNHIQDALALPTTVSVA